MHIIARLLVYNSISILVSFKNPNLKPEKAVEAYEMALIKNPKDYLLAKKIGQALIKSHHYNKAISYYLAALKSGQQNLLKYDLAELYTKLNQFDNAEKIITDAMADNSKIK